MKAALPLMALALFLPAKADEVAKVKEPIAGFWVLPGTYYKEVRDFKVMNPAMVSFTHSLGKEKIRFEKIEPKYRELLGYDKRAADAYEAELAAKEAEKKELLRQMEEVRQKMAEVEEKKKALDAQIVAADALKQRRKTIFMELQFSSYGTKEYWMSDLGRRRLADAAWLGECMKAGYTAEESVEILQRYRYRWRF